MILVTFATHSSPPSFDPSIELEDASEIPFLMDACGVLTSMDADRPFLMDDLIVSSEDSSDNGVTHEMLKSMVVAGSQQNTGGITANQKILAQSSNLLTDQMLIPRANIQTDDLPYGTQFIQPDSPFVVTQDGSSLYITDVRNGQRVNEFSVEETVQPSTVQFSPDNTHLIFSSGSIEGGSHSYFIRIGDHTLRLLPRIGLCSELKWIDDGSFLFTDVRNHSFQLNLNDVIPESKLVLNPDYYPCQRKEESQLCTTDVFTGYATITHRSHLYSPSIRATMAGPNWIQYSIRTKGQNKLTFVNIDTDEVLNLEGYDTGLMIDEQTVAGINSGGIDLFHRQGDLFVKERHFRKLHLRRVCWFVSNENESTKKYLFWIKQSKKHSTVHGIDVQSREIISFDKVKLSQCANYCREGSPFIVSVEGDSLYLTDLRNNKRSDSILFCDRTFEWNILSFSADNTHVLIHPSDASYLLKIDGMILHLIKPSQVGSHVRWLSNDLFILTFKKENGHQCALLKNVNRLSEKTVIPSENTSISINHEFIPGSRFPVSYLLSHSDILKFTPSNHISIGDSLLRLEYETIQNDQHSEDSERLRDRFLGRAIDTAGVNSLEDNTALCERGDAIWMQDPRCDARTMKSNQLIEHPNLISHDTTNKESRFFPSFVRIIHELFVSTYPYQITIAGSNWIRLKPQMDRINGKIQFVNIKTDERIKLKGSTEAWMIDENRAVGLLNKDVYFCHRNKDSFEKGKRIHLGNKVPTKKPSWFVIVNNQRNYENKYLFWIASHHGTRAVIGIDLQTDSLIHFPKASLNRHMNNLLQGTPLLVSSDGEYIYLSDVRNGECLNKVQFSETILYNTVRLSPDCKHLLFKTVNDYQIYLLNVDQMTVQFIMDGQNSSILSWLNNDLFSVTFRDNEYNLYRMVKHVKHMDQEMVVLRDEPDSNRNDKFVVGSSLLFSQLLCHKGISFCDTSDMITVRNTIFKVEYVYINHSKPA